MFVFFFPASLIKIIKFEHLQYFRRYRKGKNFCETSCILNIHLIKGPILLRILNIFRMILIFVKLYNVFTYRRL